MYIDVEEVWSQSVTHRCVRGRKCIAIGAVCLENVKEGRTVLDQHYWLYPRSSGT